MTNSKTRTSQVKSGSAGLRNRNGDNRRGALRNLSDNQMDLILLDVVMPGMDGFEVIRRIRQDNTHRLVPIILVTALREPEARVKGIEAGCDDFISTPVDRMELITRIKSLLKLFITLEHSYTLDNKKGPK